MSEDIDLAIRVGQSKESSLKQKRIGEFRDVLCGKPEYIASKPWQELAYIANTWQGNEINHQLHSQARQKINSATHINKNKTAFIYVADALCVTNSFYTCLVSVYSTHLEMKQ